MLVAKPRPINNQEQAEVYLNGTDAKIILKYADDQYSIE
jgi:hypothetical protein